MNKYYFVAHFAVNGLDESLFRNVEGLEDAMKSELVRAYNLYCNKANNLIPEMNREYDLIRGDNEWDHVDDVRYNKFVANYFTKHILAKDHFDRVSDLLGFYIDPDNDAIFTGYLKMEPSVTIYFYLKTPEES